MILERLKQYIDYKGISVSAFEKSIGMGNASFGKSLKNKGAIGTDKLENILSTYPDISPEWLLTGQGGMLRSYGVKLEPEDQETLKDLVKSQKNEIQYLREKIEEKDEVISNLSKINLKLIEKGNS
ncbi:hypothetical protein SDC9_190804 [bioreactor metagenome]|uniref:HTH cro/C1-type domain-containing protein n=1 Tax=bioreactor metagenome TaxID=1076179 RepID=A0A645HW13_9ZZZZ